MKTQCVATLSASGRNGHLDQELVSTSDIIQNGRILLGIITLHIPYVLFSYDR